METHTVTSKYLAGELVDGRYRIIKLLGQGGMAEVYQAEDIEMHNRTIALKLLFTHISMDKNNIERFIREVEITQKHIHPSIVRSYHYGKTPRNEQYFTMEYVEGSTLADILKEKGKLPFNDVFYYTAQIASALAAAHRLGIIHRDIKPDNIIITKQNEVRITDFGIAKDLNSSVQLTDLEKGPKSYAYKAPELYVKAYDHRVDIYSLGITVYELLTGKLPFQGERHQLLVAHLSMPVPKFAGGSSGIPSWFQQLVDTATAKKPEGRFDTAEQLCLFLKKHSAQIAGYDLSFLDEIKVSAQNKTLQQKVSIKNKLISFLGTVSVKYVISTIIAAIIYFLTVPQNSTEFNKDGNSLVGDSLDLYILDNFFRFRGAVTPPEGVVLITIDEFSYERFGLSTLKPWPREKMAELLEALRDAAPKMVVFDFAFIKILNPTLEELDTDKRLAKAFKFNPTYVSRFLNTQASISESKLSGSRVEIWNESDKQFVDSAAGVFLGMGVNRGVVRNFYFGPGIIRDKNRRWITPSADLVYGEKVYKEEIPDYYSMINFYGPHGSITNIPIYKVLEGSFKEGFFRDKIIFIGQHLSLGYEVRQRDTSVTPFGGYTAGVEIHATTAGNILEKNWIRRLPVSKEVYILCIAALLLSYITISTSPSAALIIVVSSLIFWPVFSYILFLNYKFFPGILLVIFVVPVSYLFSVLRVYIKKRETDKVLGIDEIYSNSRHR